MISTTCKKKILIISPHPDDMEIGMGGTVAKLCQNNEVVSLTVTDGGGSPNPFELDRKTMIDTRRKESIHAANLLRVNDSIFLSIPTVKDDYGYAEAKSKILKELIKFSPNIVFTMHPELDKHETHRIVSLATLDSISEYGKNKVDAVYAYEVWGLFSNYDELVFIDDFVATKIKSIEAHQSQVACISYCDAVIGLNRWRAVFSDSRQSGMSGSFAEPFIRLI